MISSQPCYQTQLSAGTFGHYQSPHTNHKSRSSVSTQPSPMRPGGRKRSRDEASINLEPDLSPTPAVDSRQEWAKKDDMDVFQPVGGNFADASNLFDSFLQQNSANDQKAKQNVQAHQSELHNHKFQRLDQITETGPLCSTLHQPAPGPSPGDDANPTRQSGLVIDSFTLHLGIGWRSISGDDHIQAAARGWARFIENNFGLTDVRILLESRALQSYLIEASTGYFLFAENLRQGRLVSPTAEGALKNLQLSPVQFEGPELELSAKGNEGVNTFEGPAMVLDL